MQELISTKKEKEKAILIARIPQGQNDETTQGYLDELAFLSETLDIEVIEIFTQKLEKPHPQIFLGKGKMEEVVNFVQGSGVDMLIFDDDLSPSQVRNIERLINGSEIENAKVKIMDRSLLILDIFALRAQTSQAKAQVELAQYEYTLPRLTRMWTHLSKQKGGIGMRGPGEKELETDRRIIKDKITLLKEKLAKIDNQNITRRKSRQNQVRVALVGYTNVGKSTLMQKLSKADVLAENKLFATLDSTVRKVVIDQFPFLLTDTVGFIRKLPTTLIECFKSTLDEVREADILLHVVDVSNSQFESQIETVNQTLLEIGIENKPTLLIYNKVDLLEDSNNPPRYWGSLNDAVKTEIFVSAAQNHNIDILREELVSLVSEKYYEIYPNYA